MICAICTAPYSSKRRPDLDKLYHDLVIPALDTIPNGGTTPSRAPSRMYSLQGIGRDEDTAKCFKTDWEAISEGRIDFGGVISFSNA